MTLPRIPSPAELLPAPPDPAAVEAQVAHCVEGAIAVLRMAPTKPCTVKCETPVAHGVADAFRAAGWSVSTHQHRGGTHTTVTIRAAEPVDPRDYR